MPTNETARVPRFHCTLFGLVAYLLILGPIGFVFVLIGAALGHSPETMGLAWLFLMFALTPVAFIGLGMLLLAETTLVILRREWSTQVAWIVVVGHAAFVMWLGSGWTAFTFAAMGISFGVTWGGILGRCLWSSRSARSTAA